MDQFLCDHFFILFFFPDNLYPYHLNLFQMTDFNGESVVVSEYHCSGERIPFDIISEKKHLLKSCLY